MYERNGIKYPRVTDIISDCTDSSSALIQWAANQTVEWIKENCDKSIDILDDWYHVCGEDLEQARFAYKDTSHTALDVGSNVHNAIEKHLKGETFTLLSNQAETAFKAFLKWKEEVDLVPLKLEQIVWGERWAGTLDFFGKYKGRLYIIDWKTSKAFYMTEMGAQIAAYRSCVPDAEGSGILRLDKETGLPEWKDFSKRYLRDLDVFNKMVDLYFAKHTKIRARFENKS